MQSNAFTLTAELALHDQTTAENVLGQARLLADSVDGIQIAESPGAGAQVSPLALAGILIRNGIDAIPRLTCRDRNRIALQSDLLGMRAIGVTSVMLTRGGDIPKDHEVMAKPVFDVTCHELIAMAHAIDDGMLIGTDATVFSPPADRDTDELLARANAGARFLQTQPCSNIDELRQFMQGLVEAKITWSYSLIVTLSPEREGVESCAELMREISGIPGVSGVNLLCLENPETVIAAIAASELR